jgi:phosphopantothenoylcysteine decarboxylase/phosphopantothenate--cysteine ligase
MWLHPATVDNLARLRERGVSVVDPAIGAQACGDAGPGRMPEPHELLAMLEGALGAGPLAGVRAVVTAGPTREPLDPVRYLGNRSSGRMGYAVASALAAAGASVDLVSGPVGLGDPPGVRCIRIETAAEMRAAVVEVLDGAALFVGCAAVADYRPVEPAGEKIKKDADRLTVELVKNPDILAEVAAARPRPFTVGFAAETTKLREYAEDKRRAKDLDMIAANLVGPGRLGFDTANNALLVLWEGGGAELPVLPKPVLAERLVSLIIERMHAQTAAEDT